MNSLSLHTDEILLYISNAALGVPVAQSLLIHLNYFLKHQNSEGI